MEALPRERKPSRREKGVHNWSWPLTETENIEFVWELRKSGFVKAAVSRAVRLLECPLGEFLL